MRVTGSGIAVLGRRMRADCSDLKMSTASRIDGRSRALGWVHMSPSSSTRSISPLSKSPFRCSSAASRIVPLISRAYPTPIPPGMRMRHGLAEGRRVAAGRTPFLEGQPHLIFFFPKQLCDFFLHALLQVKLLLAQNLGFCF